MEEVTRKLIQQSEVARRIAGEQGMLSRHLREAAQSICPHPEYKPVKGYGSRCVLCGKPRD